MLINSENLTATKQSKLRKLLDSDEFSILIEVLTSKAFEHEVTAANCIIEDRPGYDIKAKESARKAKSIHENIAILKEMQAAESHKIYSAKPNTNTKP